MSAALTGTILIRKDHRIVIHTDYCQFYAAVVEHENPALRSLPLAIQQKNIVVTCNYEARRRGLRKLQLISEAKRLCPDVVIVLGEQLDRFRDASKALYKYLESFTWNKKVEKLGFDEVFLDVTDIIDYNVALLNSNDLSHSFLQLSYSDPTIGFSFDATEVAGYEYPERAVRTPLQTGGEHDLRTRLVLGSHLAQHIRRKLEEEKGYTSTVGVSTSKLLAKLVGKVHKPKAQTTLMPPYECTSPLDSNDIRLLGVPLQHAESQKGSTVTRFIDSHDIGKIPGIGFKMSHKIRSHVLSREAEYDEGLVYGGTKESVTVGDVRLFQDMGPELLEKLLGGPGAERGIGGKVWSLINGIDDAEVKELRKIPSQISIEDSYIRLETLPQVRKELRILGTSLLRRMHIDLLEDDEDVRDTYSPLCSVSVTNKRWVAHPKTVRLTTRPRPAFNPDGTRTRTFNRISRSSPLPNFIFDLRVAVDVVVEQLVREVLIPMFHHLHPEKQGWNLSLMNIGVTNMIEAASEDGSGSGRDIGRMFKRQTNVLREWKVEDKDTPPDHIVDERTENETATKTEIEFLEDLPLEKQEPSASDESARGGSEDVLYSTQNTVDEDMIWQAEDDEDCDYNRCSPCDAIMPAFAMAAHERFHILVDE